MPIESVNPNEFLWVEKYRPNKLSDAIIPNSLKDLFSGYVAEGQLPNFLFSGTAGIGKTTIARAICNELGIEVLFINASESGGIDTLRTTIRQFCSSVSLTDSAKMVILDEADNLTSGAQAALRGFIEEFSSNARFIFTVNYKNKIIEPLRTSRFVDVDFKIESKDKPALASKMLARAEEILKLENVEYDRAAVGAIVKRDFPDFRRTIQSLQRFSNQYGKITLDSVESDSVTTYTDLISILKDKNWASMRKWVGQNSDLDSTQLMSELYAELEKSCKKESLPDVILIISDYMYKAAFSADHQILISAMLTELMGALKF